MPTAALIRPHQLFAPHPAVAGRWWCSSSKTLFFRQFTCHDQKLMLHRATVRRYAAEVPPKAKCIDAHQLEQLASWSPSRGDGTGRSGHPRGLRGLAPSKTTRRQEIREDGERSAGATGETRDPEGVGSPDSRGEAGEMKGERAMRVFGMR